MLSCTPIGFIRNNRQELYQVPYQIGLLDNMSSIIELEKGHNYEEALADLENFERLWVIFHFHKATTWKPKITPPRGNEKKGLFATRSPHRPNPIGISAVKLIKIDGLKIFIEDHDFIDGTPVLDIKPYLPYVDSFPQANCGWLDKVENSTHYSLICGENFQIKHHWLLENGLNLIQLIDVTLSLQPFPKKENRISENSDGTFTIAVKTWRIKFIVENSTVTLLDIFSGYDDAHLSGAKKSRWNDLPIHQKFVEKF